MGEGRTAAPADLGRALRLYLLACAILWLMLIGGGFAQGAFQWPR
jgi:adenosylcobinamide-phosphate synthase